ncbi:MAG: hypothetical protein F6J98_26225 [Moorea sp. SIO4G2]|nr:hypothetical protein [Moorena sp. SIO4G2]
MQRGLGGFPHERLHQDREFGVSPGITIAPKPDSTVPLQPSQLLIFPLLGGVRGGFPTPFTPNPTPCKALKAVCHPVSRK